MGKELERIGESKGIVFVAEYMARPDGDEIWALTSVAKERVYSLYATSEHKVPDGFVDGVLVEVKTPESVKKIATRFKSGSEQFVAYPDEPKIVVMSLLKIPWAGAKAREIAERFIGDGTLDDAWEQEP